MKVCTITPPSPFLLDERVFLSLGILKVAASLEQAGHEVEHLDLSGITNYGDVLRDYCRTSSTRTFAITATTPQMPAAFTINQTIKKELPDAKTILGGPHATLINAAAKGEQRKGIEGRGSLAMSELRSGFDCVVAGDGETAVLCALDAGAGNLQFLDGDDPKSQFWLTSQTFTESPWPARHLVDVDSYHYTIDGEKATHLVSQLGCPMNCQFCSGRNSPMLRRIRLRPPDNVVAEILYLHERYGYRGFNFFDDELNINRQMLPLMRQLRDASKERCMEWRLRGFLKAELLTEEQAAAMYEAGFRWVLIGFESGDDRILTNIQKQATKEENTQALQIARRAGLKVKALMSMGHAGESESSVLATRDWLLGVKPEDFDLTVMQPYPGSPYWDSATPVGDFAYCYTSPKTGDRLWMDDIDFCKEASYYKGASGAYVSNVWTDHLSKTRIVQLRDEVEDEVRRRLDIPYPAAQPGIQFDHSMAAGAGFLPAHILRGSHAGKTSAS